MTRPLRRLLAVAGLLTAVVVLAGCRLDVAVSVDMEPDGTGVVTVVATADADLIAQAPGVLDDLRFDDATAAGWTVGEPVTAADGAVELTLTHDFHSAEELANVLNSIGPPLTSMQVARTPGSGDTEGQVTNAVIGTLQLPSGFDSFSDSDLTAAVGGLPFGDLITASGVTPEQALGVTLRIDLPGEVLETDGTEVSEGGYGWSPTMDGSTTEVNLQTVQRPASEGGAWAGPLSVVALVALIAWVVLAGGFIAFVAIARRSKRRRREQALKRLR